MDWNTYYEKFYDWANSTQINRLSQLTFFGPADEVTEVAQELLNEKAASRLIRKALAAGVTFSAENIYDLMDCCDTATMNLLLAAVNAASRKNSWRTSGAAWMTRCWKRPRGGMV